METQIQHLLDQIAALQVQVEASRTRELTTAKLKLSKPETYSGSSKQDDVSQWLFSMRQYLQLSGANSCDGIIYAASYLRGAAAIWWRLRAQNYGAQGGFQNWEEFETELTKQFRPINAEKLARDQLASLTQLRSVQEYVSRFKSICLQISNVSEEEMMDRFVRGLKPMVQREVELRDPQTFDEAVRIAERVDAINFRNRGVRPPVWNPTPPSTVVTQQSTPMEIDALQGPLTPQRRQLLARKGLCFYCRESGHQIGDCPKRQNSGANKSRRIHNLEVDQDDEGMEQENGAPQ
jgi:hypothetical protein